MPLSATARSAAGFALPLHTAQVGCGDSLRLARSLHRQFVALENATLSLVA